LTGVLLGGAEVGMGTAMNTPAGYLFTQGINADQVYTGGEVSKYIVAPLSSSLSLFGVEPAEHWKNAVGIGDLALSLVGLGVAHATLEGGRKGALAEAKAKYDKGEDLKGSELKLLVETVGDEIKITLDGATSFRIVQGAGQYIRIGNDETTVGPGGTIVTTQQGDSITMVCSVANTKWNVISPIGNPIVA